MKKFLKVVAKILGCLILLSIPAAYLFGSTTHSNLKGTEKEKVKQFIDTFVEEKDFNGSILVIHKDKVLLDQSYGLADQEKELPFKNDELFPIGSVTKSMTAVAILQLDEQEKLSIEDQVSKYFPDLPNGNKIKIRHLLNHTSGLGDYLTMKDYWKPYSEEKILEIINKEALKIKQENKFKYGNSNFYLLGKIIEKVSGEDYSTYLKRHIFDQAGMKETVIINKDYKNLNVVGYENGKKVKNIDPSLLLGAGDVLSTKMDLAKYIAAIESYKLLSEDKTKKMLHPTVKANLVDYGYGWYVINNVLSFKERMYTHGGSMPGLRSIVMRYDDKDLTIIAFCNRGSEWNLVALGNELASIVFDKRLWFYHKIQ